MDKGLQRLKGTRDMLDGEAQSLETAGRTLQSVCSGYGYDLIDTPVLEPPELFLRKSGGEIASHMYSFTDPGGRPVSLRPEFTASVIRGYLQGGSRRLPLRWQYRGPVFQYAGDGQPGRQLTQVGAELIGASGPLADAEVLSLALEGLHRLGLRGFRVNLGHIGIPSQWLGDLGLSEKLRLFLVGRIGELSQGRGGKNKVEEELRQQALRHQEASAPRAGRRGEDRRAMLRALVQDMAPEMQGGRSSEEIVSRFVSRSEAWDKRELAATGLSLTAELALVRGEPASALRDARQIAHRYGVDGHALDGLEELLSLLSDVGLGEGISVDLGLARGLAYYTGMVFEARHQGLPPGPSLCGGGRYDGLVKSLGGADDVPALGFAYCLERLVAALATEGVATAPAALDVVLCPAVKSAGSAAMKAARAMREKGLRVRLELSGLSAEDTLSEARRQGVARVTLVDEAGEVREHVFQ